MCIKRILSVSGGGIRGIAAAQFLKRLEDEMGINLFNVFDMYGGTSTGSFIITAIAYEKMCGDMIVNELYSYNNAQIIMPKSFWDIKLGILQNIAKYDGVGKREIIDRYISDKELCDTEKDVIIGAFDLKKQRPKFFKSWGKDKIGIRDAIDISSAAPCYFKPVKYTDPSIPNTNLYAIDGGVCVNDPTDCIYADAIKKYGKEADIRILSIGTGRSSEDKWSQNDCEDAMDYGTIQWLLKGDLVGIMTDGPQDTVHYRVQSFSEALGHKYFRVNGVMENTEMDDVSYDNIEKLKKDWR